MNIEQSLTLAHDCPEAGFSCPGCNGQENLHYRIDRDEYVCGECGLVSTVNEVVEHSRELRRKGEVEDGKLGYVGGKDTNRIGSNAATDVRSNLD